VATRSEWSLSRYGVVETRSWTDLISALTEEGQSEEDTRCFLVDDICGSKKILNLDYYGCFVEVFAADKPEGAISQRDLFPNVTEDCYLLLNADHVETMLLSLDAHRDELWVMTEADLTQLASWRDICRHDSGFLVAYHFAF